MSLAAPVVTRSRPNTSSSATRPPYAFKFYRHESCGQCTPCREGSAWLDRTLIKLLDGKASMQELDDLSDIANNIMGNTICAFGEGTAMPALGFLGKFRKEFEKYVTGEKTRKDARLTVS